MANDKGFFNYCVATNSGKGFITHTDSRKFEIRVYPGNVWVCDDIPESRDWGARNSAALYAGGTPPNTNVTEEWTTPQNVEIITD